MQGSLLDETAEVYWWGGECRTEWGMCEVVWVSLWAPIQGSWDESVGGPGGGGASPRELVNAHVGQPERVRGCPCGAA